MENIEFIDLSQELREDDRGFSFYPLKGRVEDLANLPNIFHLVSIAPNQVRGNHLHPTRWEWLYLIHGTGTFRWEPQPGETREREVSGHRLLIHIPAGVAHSLRNPGPGPIYLLAWREGELEGAEDTVTASFRLRFEEGTQRSPVLLLSTNPLNIAVGRASSQSGHGKDARATGQRGSVR